MKSFTKACTAAPPNPTKDLVEVAASSAQGWATPGDVAAKLQRLWVSGTPLAAHVSGEEWGPLRVPIRGPKSRDIVDRYEDVRAFKQQWQKFATRRPMHDHITLELRAIGGRLAGVNTVPSAVMISSVLDLSRVVGHSEDVAAFAQAVDRADELDPRLRRWIIEHPKRALNHVEHLSKLVDAAVRVAAAGDTLYVRQIDVPDVDTKFIERNRTIISELVGFLSADDAPRVSDRGTYAPRHLGLREKPRYVRVRLLKSPHGFPSGISEIAVRTDELGTDLVGASRVFVVENETTFLTFPDLDDAIVVFGDGYSAATVSLLPWLAEREVYYWGDIDTHGFGILNSLRSRHAGVRSIMMDRRTLLSHDRHWVVEPSQLRAPLHHLSASELALYEELLGGDLGRAVRLEQERVAPDYVDRCLAWCR